jgi:hypothetical protein
MIKSPAQYQTRNRPEATAHGARRPAIRGRPKSWLSHGLQPSPARQTACAARCNTRAPVRSPRAGWRGGVLTGGSAVAQRRQGVVGDLEGATGKVLGKEEREGAHQNGGSTVRRRKLRRAAVFNGGGVAPVVADVHGGVLQHWCERGKLGLAPIWEW